MSNESDLLCGKCCLSISEQECIQCDSYCKQWYHKVCTELPDDRYDFLISDRRKWKCGWCLSCIELNRTVTVTNDVDGLLPSIDVVVNRFTPNNIFNSHENWLLFKDNVNQTYKDIACFKKNLFNLPSGAVGKEFIKELTFWLSQVNFAGSNMNSVALKCFMILPTLLLQKPHAKSKTREHVECMKRRLQLWKCVDPNVFL